MANVFNRPFCLLSHALPPAPSGQAVALYRLLRAVPEKEYILIGSGQGQNALLSGHLPAKTYQFGGRRRESFPFLKMCRPAWLWSLRRQVDARARNIEKILRAEACSLLVACSGDLLDLPAGAIAASRAKIIFVPYFFDDYQYQWTGARRKIAEKFEREFIEKAAGAITPNEFLANDYQQRYGLNCRVVRNPTRQNGFLLKRQETYPPRIVYTGSVYHAHQDAFVNLVKALNNNDSDTQLHIYTSQTSDDLARLGIAGNRVIIHEHVDQQATATVQQQADILFLPLAFDSPIPEVLRTSAPGKLGEYLGSGRPILVHAPPDSFLSWFFNKHRCGCVVDSPDPVELAGAVQSLLSGIGVPEMVDRARRISCAEFAEDSQAAALVEYLLSLHMPANDPVT